MNWVIVTAPMGRDFYLRKAHRYPDLFRADPADARLFKSEQDAEDTLRFLQRRFRDDQMLRRPCTRVQPEPRQRFDSAADRGLALAAEIIARLKAAGARP